MVANFLDDNPIWLSKFFCSLQIVRLAVNIYLHSNFRVYKKYRNIPSIKLCSVVSLDTGAGVKFGHDSTRFRTRYRELHEW